MENHQVPGPAHAYAAVVMGNSLHEWERSYNTLFRGSAASRAVQEMAAWRAAMLERHAQRQGQGKQEQPQREQLPTQREQPQAHREQLGRQRRRQQHASPSPASPHRSPAAPRSHAEDARTSDGHCSPPPSDESDLHTSDACTSNPSSGSESDGDGAASMYTSADDG